MKKLVRIAVALSIVIFCSAAGAYYWIQAGKTRSTENAYVNADIVQIASQLTGPVAKVYVHEGQLVSAGQPLFDIDAAPYEVALTLTEAKLSEASQSVRQGQSDVRAYEAGLAQAEADLNSAKANAHRTQSLVLNKFLSNQAADDALVKVKLADAGVLLARAKLSGAQTHVATVGGDTPSVLAERAGLAQAKLNLAHTHVVASKDGWITNLTLVEGTTVSTGVPLFSLIARNSFWVDANFKETELPGIKVGQPVTTEIDMQPDQSYAGVVESIGNGTGSAFSLLPAQNATGNWVKVTQRVPVRIRFTDQTAVQSFRVGATAHVTVHIKS
jgi:membrane fusion protein (multidrug efflux system)